MMDSNIEESTGDDENVDQCSICIEDLGQSPLEVYDESRTASACSCGHVFHTGCLRHWLRINSCCPTCKAKQHLSSSGCKPSTITRLFLSFQGTRAPIDDDIYNTLELLQETVRGLKQQLADAEATVEAAEDAASAAAEREVDLKARGRAAEMRAANEVSDLKRRLGEVTRLLELETQKRLTAESKSALGAYVNAMLAGTSTSTNASDQLSNHSHSISSSCKGDGSDSKGLMGTRGHGPTTSSLSLSLSSSTTLQRQAALGAASRVCSLEEVVAVQQRLLVELRAGKIAAERRLAKALRSSAAFTVVPSAAGEEEEADGVRNEQSKTRRASRTRRDTGKFKRVNPFLNKSDAHANASPMSLSKSAGDGDEGTEEDDNKGDEDDEEEDDFNLSAINWEPKSSDESNTTTEALAVDHSDSSDELEFLDAAGTSKRKSGKEWAQPKADHVISVDENCEAANLVDGVTSGNSYAEHKPCKLCTFVNEPSTKKCTMCGSALISQVEHPAPARKRPRKDSSSATLTPQSFATQPSVLPPRLYKIASLARAGSRSSSSSSSSSIDFGSSSSRSSSNSRSSLSRLPPSAAEVEAKAFALFLSYGGPGAAMRLKERGASAVPAWCAPTGGTPAAVAHTVKRAWLALSHSTRQPWLDQAARKLAGESAKCLPGMPSGLHSRSHCLK